MKLMSDLVEEILSWVPTRSLLRLKYTCKQWESLTVEPRFIKKHLSHMRGREQQFTVFNDVSSPQVSYLLGIDFDELKNPGLNLQVFQPISSPELLVQNMYHCDGLLLFVMRAELLVLNPVLKQARWIKRGYGIDRLKDVYGYGLGYISNQSSGLCDYRMVRFRCGASNAGKSRIEVYEFNSGSWKVVFDKFFNGFLELPESSVCLQGTPYWISCLNGKAFAMIQSFDFSKERFEPLFIPPSCIGSDKLENSLSLGVFRGNRLSLLHKSRTTGKIHLWVMKKHWSKLVRFALPEFSMCPKYSSYFIENNGKLVLSIRHFRSFVIHIVGENLECQKVKYSSKNLFGGFGCYFVPSLLPVPGFLEAGRTRSDFFKKKRTISDNGFRKKEWNNML